MSQDTQPPPCRLLTLPRELRDIIYEYTFSIEVDISKNGEDQAAPQTSRVAFRNAGLLLSCKQIHNETHDLYFKTTKFFSPSLADLLEWLKAMPARTRGCIKHVRLLRLLEVKANSTQAMVDGFKSYCQDRFLQILADRDIYGRGSVLEVEMILLSEVAGHRHAAVLEDWLSGRGHEALEV